MQRNSYSNGHFAWILLTHGVLLQDRISCLHRRILVRQTDDEIGSPFPCTTRRLEFCTESRAVKVPGPGGDILVPCKTPVARHQIQSINQIKYDFNNG